MHFLQADEDPNLVPQMGDNAAFTFNPQGPPGADGAGGGAGPAAGGTSEPAASAGGQILGDAAPFQFWRTQCFGSSSNCIKILWSCIKIILYDMNYWQSRNDLQESGEQTTNEKLSL